MLLFIGSSVTQALILKTGQKPLFMQTGFSMSAKFGHTGRDPATRECFENLVPFQPMFLSYQTTSDSATEF